MLVPFPVVFHSAALGQLPCPFQRNKPHIALFLRGQGAEFHCIHRFAHVPAAGSGDVFHHAVLQAQRAVQVLFHHMECPLHRRTDFFRLYRLKFKHGGPAQNRIIDIKIWILRCRSDQSNLPVFDEFQKRLLLFFIKVLDLVQIEQHAVHCVQTVQARNHFADVRGRSSGPVQFAEFAVGLLCDDGSQCRLSHAGWAVEDQIGDHPRGKNPAQGFPFPQQMALAYHLIQRLGTDAVRQWAHQKFLLYRKAALYLIRTVRLFQCINSGLDFLMHRADNACKSP